MTLGITKIGQLAAIKVPAKELSSTLSTRPQAVRSSISGVAISLSPAAQTILKAATSSVTKLAKPQTLPAQLLKKLSQPSKLNIRGNPAPSTISAAITAFKAAQAAGTLSGFAAVSIKDVSSALTSGSNLADLSSMAAVGKIAGITFSDPKPVIALDRAGLLTDLSDPKSTVGNVLLLQQINTAYTLNLTNVGASDAATIKTPAKNTILQISVVDSAVNVSANLDKLESVAKAKALKDITLTDLNSANLNVSEASIKSDSDALTLVRGNYSLEAKSVVAADVVKIAATGHLAGIDVADTAANVLKNISLLTSGSASSKIKSVTLTDKVSPTVSIADALSLAALPKLSIGQGLKLTIADTASNIITHARYDIGDVIANAGSIALTNAAIPYLTLVDAKILTGLKNLQKGTKYNIADGGNTIANQALISGEAILKNSFSIVVDKAFTVVQAQAVTALSSFSKTSPYAISDTVASILSRSAVKNDKLLSGATAVTVNDTAYNISKNIDALESLSREGKITNIIISDMATGAVITVDPLQQTKDSDALGKIVGPDGKKLMYAASLVNLTPQSASTNLYYIAPDAAYAYGWQTINNQNQALIVHNGAVLNLIPTDATWSSIYGMSVNGTAAYGVYQNSNTSTSFIVQKGSLTALRPPEGLNSSYVNISGISGDGNVIIGTLPIDNNNNQNYFRYYVDSKIYTRLSNVLTLSSGSTSAALNQDGSISWVVGSDQTTQSRYLVYLDAADAIHKIDIPSNNGISISGVSADGVNAYGTFVDKNNNQHVFTVDQSGNFINQTPNSIGSYVWFKNNSPSPNIEGEYSDAVGKYHNFLIQNASFYDLDALSGGTYTQINGWSKDGSTAYGNYTTSTGAQHLFTFQNGYLTDITPKDATAAWLSAISSDGSSIFGTCTKADGSRFNFINSSGSISMLPDSPSILSSINAVVGNSALISNDGKTIWGTVTKSDGSFDFIQFDVSTLTFVKDIKIANSVGSYNASVILKSNADNSRFYGTYNIYGPTAKAGAFVIQGSDANNFPINGTDLINGLSPQLMPDGALWLYSYNGVYSLQSGLRFQ